jgi:hypothetical protein
LRQVVTDTLSENDKATAGLLTTRIAPGQAACAEFELIDEVSIAATPTIKYETSLI